MKKISVTQTVRASLDKVWDILSDVDNDTKYYRGMSEIRNLSRDDNKIEREVTVGFFKHKARQTILLKPKVSVEVIMAEGPLQVTRVTRLTQVDENNTKIEISWDVPPSGMPSFVHSRVEKEILDGTREGLQKIANQLELASNLAAKQGK